MTYKMKQAWDELLMPMLRRPPEWQVAALCYRDAPEGRQVLLITSRDTGRWIVPKGWPIEGKKAAEAALQEAWEEAGVRDCAVVEGPVGCYDYAKRLDAGYEAPVEAQVYKVRVNELSDIYPEARQRQRKWVSPAEAAELVNEPGLKEILLEM